MKTLRELQVEINELLEMRPELGRAIVVSAKDDEGNGYNELYYDLQAGHYDQNGREFIGEDQDEWFHEGLKVNAVCIN